MKVPIGTQCSRKEYRTTIDKTPAEGASIEFAVGVLGVKEIVVCGHSGCGALKAIMYDSFFSSETTAKYPSLVQWL